MCLTAPFSGSLGGHCFILFSPCFILSFPGPPYRQSHDHRYKSGMCICTNDRCSDRTSFPVYVNIYIYIYSYAFFSQILNKHLNVAGISVTSGSEWVRTSENESRMNRDLASAYVLCLRTFVVPNLQRDKGRNLGKQEQTGRRRK